jgi:hypothetical protein
MSFPSLLPPGEGARRADEGPGATHLQKRPSSGLRPPSPVGRRPDSLASPSLLSGEDEGPGAIPGRMPLQPAKKARIPLSPAPKI